MSSLANLGIARRLSLALAVPLLLALTLGGVIIYDAWSRMRDADRVGAVMQVAPALGNFIHQVQIERGLTNSLIRNPADASLPGQRRDQMTRVDSAIVDLRRALTLIPTSIDNESVAMVRAFEASMTRLPSLREDVEGKRVNANDAVTRYSALVEDAVAPIERLAGEQRAATVMRALLAYTSVLRAKEFAGYERNAGTEGFTAIGFDPAVMPRFAALIATQDSLFAVIRRLGLPEHAAAIAALANHPAERAIIDLRQRAKNGGAQAGPPVAPADWFRAATARMNEIKVVEDRISADLVKAVAEISSDARSTLFRILSLVAIGIIIAIAAGVVMARSITGPLTSLTALMKRLAHGDLAIALDGQTRRDEIGDMTRAVGIFRDNAVERERLEQEAARSREGEVARQRHLESLIHDFRGIVTNNLSALGQETDAMRHAAGTLASASDTSTARAMTASSASQAALSNAEAVAAATEELGSSIREIAGQAQRTSVIVSEASEAARSTDKDVSSLADAVSRIGTVVSMIRAIAEQTNLLALNATIEAARAGDAGKGFAVVASEVKALATQTARATQDIEAQIGAIQNATGQTVSSIRMIAGQVAEINGLTTTIAAAVEEQEAATGEIAQNVARSADGSRQVSENVGEVGQAAEETSKEAERVAQAAEQVASVSSRLSRAVETFLTEINSDLTERRRAVRRIADGRVKLITGDRTTEVDIMDISTIGLRVTATKGFTVGDQVMVGIGKKRHAAKVIWGNDKILGLEFVERLTAVPTLDEFSDAA